MISAGSPAKLAASFPSTTEILRGSLLRRRIRHRSGCSTCAAGKGHLLRNYRKLKTALERICVLNHHIPAKGK